VALIFRVEDQLHRVLDEFRDTTDADFIRLCLRAARADGDDWPTLSIVDQYSDTMLNRIQQGRFVEELTAILDQPDLLQDAGPIVRTVLDAAQRVYRDGGYLTILGE
jgi:hypothetical protein